MQRSATSQCITLPTPDASILYALQRLLPEHLCRFEPDPDTGCLVWQSTANSSGHGVVLGDGRIQTAHVAVWEAIFGPLDAGIELHHTCPNKLCVNPLHMRPRLYTSHRADHARERWARQKADPSLNLIGVRRKTPRLTQDQRRDIWDRYMTRRATQQELADEYGVSRPTIHKIVKHPRPEESPERAVSAPQPAEGDITGTTGTADYGRGHVDTPCGGGVSVPVALEGGL